MSDLYLCQIWSLALKDKTLSAEIALCAGLLLYGSLRLKPIVSDAIPLQAGTPGNSFHYLSINGITLTTSFILGPSPREITKFEVNRYITIYLI